MGTPLHIALRYLFAKKTHNVINIISIISAAGIAIGSMALVLILSVYNGFDNSIKKIYEGYKADFCITPQEGKWISITADKLNHISDIEGIVSFNPILEENVFIKYGNKEAIASLRGVDTTYYKLNHIAGNIVEGETKSSFGEIDYVLVGQQLAHSLGLRVKFLTPVELYFPERDGDISIANPLESVNVTTCYPAAIIRTEGEDIQELLYANIGTVKELTGGKEDEYTAVEIYTGNVTPKTAKEIRQKLQDLFPQCDVKNKEEQNATLYKMMKAEKFAVYMILFFVIVIISINIFSCLSMLIADKGDDITTYLSLGAEKKMLKKIFHLHGFLISAFGCIAGTIAGTVVALLQKHFQIISIPGNYIITAYPVDIQITDIAITFIGVLATGFIISYFPAQKIFKN